VPSDAPTVDEFSIEDLRRDLYSGLMATGDRQRAREWLPVELAQPEKAAPDDVSDDSSAPSNGSGAVIDDAGDVTDEEQSPGDSVDGAAPAEQEDEDQEPTPVDRVNSAPTVEQQDQDNEPSRVPGEAEIERLFKRAEQTQGALRKAESRIEGAEERARLISQAESAIRRAAAAEATAHEAAATADRLAAKLVVLSDRLAAQEKELERQREEAAAAGTDEPGDELQIPLDEWDRATSEEREPEPEPRSSEPEPEPEPEPAPRPQPEQAPVAEPSFDINQAGFDEFCQLGLSISEAARLIGQRDQQGGFSSLDDLDHLRGLSSDTIKLLKDAASG
jgi:DNA uptake protein ComE-like DNA-binding protein